MLAKCSTVQHMDIKYIDYCYTDSLNNDCVDEKLKGLMLEETFPNIESALEIFLTLQVSNCPGEISFSLLKSLLHVLHSSRKIKFFSLAMY